MYLWISPVILTGKVTWEAFLFCVFYLNIKLLTRNFHLCLLIATFINSNVSPVFQVPSDHEKTDKEYKHLVISPLKSEKSILGTFWDHQKPFLHHLWQVTSKEHCHSALAFSRPGHWWKHHDRGYDIKSQWGFSSLCKSILKSKWNGKLLGKHRRRIVSISFRKLKQDNSHRWTGGNYYSATQQKQKSRRLRWFHRGIRSKLLKDLCSLRRKKSL